MSDSPKPRDLEQRTFLFAQSVRLFVKALPRTMGNSEDVRQLIRASGSVAANWIEANEALSKKDFLLRAKICRKEAKESRLFLRLIETNANERKARDACGRGARANVDFFRDYFKERSAMRKLPPRLEFEFCLEFGPPEADWDLGFCLL